MVFRPHLCINYAVFLRCDKPAFKHFLKQFHRHKISDLILIHAYPPSCNGTRYNRSVSSIFCDVPCSRKRRTHKQDRSWWQKRDDASSHDVPARNLFDRWQNKMIFACDRAYWSALHRNICNNWEQESVCFELLLYSHAVCKRISLHSLELAVLQRSSRIQFQLHAFQ